VKERRVQSRKPEVKEGEEVREGEQGRINEDMRGEEGRREGRAYLGSSIRGPKEQLLKGIDGDEFPGANKGLGLKAEGKCFFLRGNLRRGREKGREGGREG